MHCLIHSKARYIQEVDEASVAMSRLGLTRVQQDGLPKDTSVSAFFG